MADKRKIYQFLRDLTANNSKDWMDENRERYHEAKDIWLEEIDLILQRLANHDARYGTLRPKDCVTRINNNRMFHPDRPVYKDHFAFSPSGKDEPALYLHVSPKESFIGGGIHNAENKVLKSLREAIDYDGEELLKITSKQPFQGLYGGLAADPNQLKTSPRGYDQEHRHIELLRRKSFTGIRHLTQKEIVSDDLVDIVEQAYLAVKPLNDYLARALSV